MAFKAERYSHKASLQNKYKKLNFVNAFVSVIIHKATPFAKTIREEIVTFILFGLWN
jgi:hypothetical protein